MYSLQYRPQMDHNKYEENEGGGFAAAPIFFIFIMVHLWHVFVGCTWLMYSLCMAHIWPMYDPHMTHIAFRSAISYAIRPAQRTDHQGTLAKKM